MNVSLRRKYQSITCRIFGANSSTYKQTNNQNFSKSQGKKKAKELKISPFFFFWVLRNKKSTSKTKTLGTSCGVREMRAVSARRGRSGGRRADRVEKLRVEFRISALEKVLLEVKRRVSAVVAFSRSRALLPIF